MKKKLPRISSFDLSPGDHLSEKYEVVSRLGSGWEGEVYLVRETGTRIDRTVDGLPSHADYLAKFLTPEARPRSAVV